MCLCSRSGRERRGTSRTRAVAHLAVSCLTCVARLLGLKASVEGGFRLRGYHFTPTKRGHGSWLVCASGDRYTESETDSLGVSSEE